MHFKKILLVFLKIFKILKKIIPCIFFFVTCSALKKPTYTHLKKKQAGK